MRDRARTGRVRDLVRDRLHGRERRRHQPPQPPPTAAADAAAASAVGRPTTGLYIYLNIYIGLYIYI